MNATRGDSVTDRCTPGNHVYQVGYPTWAWVTSSHPVSMMLGDDPDDWSDWFTCCEVNAIRRARAAGTKGAVNARLFLRLWKVTRSRRLAWRLARAAAIFPRLGNGRGSAA